MLIDYQHFDEEFHEEFHQEFLEVEMKWDLSKLKNSE